MSTLTIQPMQMPAPERAIPGTRGWERMHADHLARYFFAARHCERARVLDAGTGPGYGAAILHEAGARQVMAVDIDAPTIAQAAATYRLPHLAFIVDDCQTLQRVEGPFDLICNFENIEHLQHPKHFLAQVVRLLDADGLFMCSTPDRNGPYQPWVNGRPNNPHHTIEWYADEFRELLSTYFEEVDVRAQVMSHAAVQRGRAVQGLVAHLDYLWSNPVLRAERAVKRLLGRPNEWPTVTGFDIPDIGDYPIVSRCVTAAVGIPFCHVALCRRARRG